MNLSRLWEKYSSDFRNNLLVMIGGTFIAQIIPLLFSFVLTRIYTPVEFGVFTNFSAVLSFVLVFMMLKFDLAIILPKKDSIAGNLIVLCILIAVCIFLVATILIYFFDANIYQLFNIDSSYTFLSYIPIAAFLYSIFNLINEWFVRKKYFKKLIVNKLVNNGSISLVSTILPAMKIDKGLIKGQIIGQFICIVSGGYIIWKKDKIFFKNINITLLKYLFKKYFDFAKFNIPGQLLNTISVQILVFYLTSQFGLLVVGLYALTDRVMGVPLSFIGNAVKDVFKQKAAEEYREFGNCLHIYKKIVLLLFAISIIPFSILFLFGPQIFGFFFGSEWSVSGDFARILAVMYFLSFITMPTGWLFVIAEKQKKDFMWQILFLFLTVSALVVGYIFFKNDIVYTLGILVIFRTIAYFVQIGMTYQLAKGNIE